MENYCGRAARPYFADPTANTAIGNVMREEREEKRKKEMEKRKLLLGYFFCTQRSKENGVQENQFLPDTGRES